MTEKKLLKKLVKIIGKDKVFLDREYLVTYSYDATANSFLPEAVCLPESEKEVQKILEFAHLHKIPVVPRGAGVGYSGGSLPVMGGIVICFTRMNKILKIEKESLLAVVEPGVITNNLIMTCEEQGLFYPPDPASLKTSTIGGNVAENAGGPRCFKYGVTGSYVLALEGFLADGTRIQMGSSAVKNVAGYDLKSLMIGSEGTLAVITKIVLRLIAKPERRILVRVDFESLPEGAEFIHLVIKSNLAPSVLEFMDKTSLDAVYDYLNLNKKKNHKASILMEFDGSAEEVAIRKKMLEELLEKTKIIDYQIASTPDEQELLWSLRRNISPAISKIKPKKINEDIAVPIKFIPETVEFINSLARELNLSIILFGHFGDGNIHTNLMVDPEDRDEMKRAAEALERIFKYVISVEGTISGEHGIGTSKKEFMHYQFDEKEMELFRQIKKVFDPDNILNPGKIF